MKKRANQLKQRDKISLAGEESTIQEIEISDIGKHGKRKVRIVAITSKGEKKVIIRPEDYPIEVI